MSDIFLGKGEHDVFLLCRYGNRHGLIAGATGTGKSVSLICASHRQDAIEVGRQILRGVLGGMTSGSRRR